LVDWALRQAVANAISSGQAAPAATMATAGPALKKVLHEYIVSKKADPGAAQTLVAMLTCRRDRMTHYAPDQGTSLAYLGAHGSLWTPFFLI
jgi:hypothetical protein